MEEQAHGKSRALEKTVNLKANKIGSECFRLWKACDAQVGDDFQINPEEIEQRYFGVIQCCTFCISV